MESTYGALTLTFHDASPTTTPTIFTATTTTTLRGSRNIKTIRELEKKSTKMMNDFLTSIVKRINNLEMMLAL